MYVCLFVCVCMCARVRIPSRGTDGGGSSSEHLPVHHACAYKNECLNGYFSLDLAPSFFFQTLEQKGSASSSFTALPRLTL